MRSVTKRDSRLFGSRKGRRRFGVLFVVLLLFYIGLSGTLNGFTLVTGTISATIVSLVFAQITFETPPRVRRLAGKLLRGTLYVPYLFWEIAKANVAIAYVALHPSLPIAPEIGAYEPEVSEPLPLTVLAISITLTPGTLILDDRGDGLDVHSMTPAAFSDLLEGRLERAVRFVFNGRGRTATQRTDGEDHDQ